MHVPWCRPRTMSVCHKAQLSRRRAPPASLSTAAQPVMNLTTWTTVFVAVAFGLHLWAAEGPQKQGTLLGESEPTRSRIRRSLVTGASLMALLCLANTPLPAPWVQWLEREPERPARLQTPYVAASGEFAPPAAAVAAAVSATGKAVGDGIHSSAAVGGGSVPEGGAAALQQAGAAAAAAPGAARNVSGNAGSTGLGAAAAAENATAKLENVRLPKVTPSRPASQRERAPSR